MARAPTALLLFSADAMLQKRIERIAAHHGLQVQMLSQLDAVVEQLRTAPQPGNRHRRGCWSMHARGAAARRCCSRHWPSAVTTTHCRCSGCRMSATTAPAPAAHALRRCRTACTPGRTCHACPSCRPLSSAGDEVPAPAAATAPARAAGGRQYGQPDGGRSAAARIPVRGAQRRRWRRHWPLFAKAAWTSLMDCQMPVLDGYAATRHWRAEEAKPGERACRSSR